MKNNKSVFICLVAFVLVLFMGACEDENGDQKVEITSLISAPVSVGPTLDGSGRDPAWNEASELVIDDVNVPVYAHFWPGYHNKSYIVKAKSVYTSSDVYFLFQWTGDASESLERESWYFNSTANMWLQKPKKEPDSYGVNPAYEDKFAVIWNIDNSIAKYNTSGCGVVCHGEYMATNVEGEMGDTWHWKRVRTGPYNQVDDKYLTFSTGNGRKSDAKESGGYSSNKQTLQIISSTGDTLEYTVPKYWIPGRTDYHWILDTEIESGTAKEIVAIDTTTMVLTDEDGTALNPEDFPVDGNNLIPSVYVAAFVGDRGDVEAYHSYSNGTWNLELKRALVTDSETDIQFYNLEDDYYFSVAVFDAAAIAHATPGGTVGITYKFEFEQ